MLIRRGQLEVTMETSRKDLEAHRVALENKMLKAERLDGQLLQEKERTPRLERQSSKDAGGGEQTSVASVQSRDVDAEKFKKLRVDIESGGETLMQQEKVQSDLGWARSTFVREKITRTLRCLVEGSAMECQESSTLTSQHR